MRLQIRLSSTVLLRPVQVTVALPDGFSRARPPFRTLWALHAAMSDADLFFSELGMEDLVQKEGFALVAPSLGNGYYVNREHERQADFLEDELLPVLRQTLPLSTERNENALFGISMGGYGALHWGLSRPETFSSVTVFSGVFERPLPDHPLLRKQRALRALLAALAPVMRRQFEDAAGNTRPEVDLQRLLEQHRHKASGQRLPFVRFFCGAEDYLALPHCEDMQARLQAYGCEATLSILPGSHDAAFWRSVIASAIEEMFTDHEVER